MYPTGGVFVLSRCCRGRHAGKSNVFVHLAALLLRRDVYKRQEYESVRQLCREQGCNYQDAYRTILKELDTKEMEN